MQPTSPPPASQPQDDVMREQGSSQDGDSPMNLSSMEAESPSGGRLGHVLSNGRVVCREYFKEFCFQYEALMASPGGHRHGVSEGGKIQDDDYSLDTCSESGSDSATGTSKGSQDDGWDEIETVPCYSDAVAGIVESEAEQTPGGRQAHKFGYSENHTCCSDSVFEFNDSYWDMSRDHSMEAEIVSAYDLPDVPRTAGEISEVPQIPFKPVEQVGVLAEIDEDDFARAVYANRKGFEQERRRWDVKMRPEATRRVHIEYTNGRAMKRNAKNARKTARSPSHERERLGKLTLRVKREAERSMRSIKEKGKEVWGGGTW
ncbi:hypothetical protein EPUS_05476 [Endocarpon pusillum Z07020]|uniref:Uncharacterized protein n=1 Tax=Endocarpon pusillum (strain Z07020 / HMAS-L-300199) TaxID=1263415 RepID=U1FYD4_ENDPU|nr:uncharacterized protein EPUS_05476 [Endocarpon pusillum Z07020]ERF69932.1 hypothetical protein EPUS_05476 [Endocarpon pusillum Z07020]